MVLGRCFGVWCLSWAARLAEAVFGARQASLMEEFGISGAGGKGQLLLSAGRWAPLKLAKPQPADPGLMSWSRNRREKLAGQLCDLSQPFRKKVHPETRTSLSCLLSSGLKSLSQKAAGDGRSIMGEGETNFRHQARRQDRRW